MGNYPYISSKTAIEQTNQIPKHKIINFRCVLGWLCCPMGSTIYLLTDIRNTMIRNEAEKAYDIQRKELLDMIILEEESVPLMFADHEHNLNLSTIPN